MAIELHSDEKFQSPAVATRPVLLAALGALLLLAAAIGGLQAIYDWQVPVQHYPAPEQFPQPRVQSGQVEQRERIEAKQKSRLTGYRWVDRAQGLVQIPIERAMQLLAAEGMQAYAPLAPAQALSSPSAGAERLMTPQADVPPPGRPRTGATSTPQSTLGAGTAPVSAPGQKP